MPGRLSLLLRIEQRQPDRVRVSVLLAPTDDPVRLDGVALGLVDEDGEALSARLLLPVAGVLSQPMASTVELRAHDDIPEGSQIVGTAWTDSGEVDVSCPADPCPDLQDHMRGRRAIGIHLTRRKGREHGLDEIEPDERCRLARVFAWLAPSAPCAPRVVDGRSSIADEISDEFGLDEDTARFVRELMEE